MSAYKAYIGMNINVIGIIWGTKPRPLKELLVNRRQRFHVLRGGATVPLFKCGGRMRYGFDETGPRPEGRLLREIIEADRSRDSGWT